MYTTGSLVAVLGALAFDALVTKQRLVARPRFWIAYAIILFFQLIMNGFLTGLPIVTYHPDVHLGLRIANAPVEDIGFGFGLGLSVLTLWCRLGPQPNPQRPREQRQRDA
jgi:lycopene cyclase domain-containing protein